jgi:hypothetical protein
VNLEFFSACDGFMEILRKEFVGNNSQTNHNEDPKENKSGILYSTEFSCRDKFLKNWRRYSGHWRPVARRRPLHMYRNTLLSSMELLQYRFFEGLIQDLDLPFFRVYDGSVGLR